MPVNPHWTRWVFASVSKHFYDRRGDVAFYIEGQERDTPAPENLLEFRLDGPYFTQMSKNTWRLYVEVSLLVQCAKTGKDYHAIHKITGQVAEAFTSIPVYKYGDTVGVDDNSFVGCLTLVQELGKRERIQTNNFGQIGPDTQLLQSSVEGHYTMDLEIS
jgi:hypothetical protein